MPSHAIDNFALRLKEVEQLVDAHQALTRFRKAQAKAMQANPNLQSISAIINVLVSNPGRGRPPEVYALNSAGIALLSGHLQGFIVDLFKETATALMTGKVSNVQTLIDVTYTKGNPNPNNINNIFGAIGFTKILSGLSWQGMSNQSLLANLRNFNELRNSIVHGKSVHVRKKTVSNYLNIFKNLAKHLDSRLRSEIHRMIGTYPW